MHSPSHTSLLVVGLTHVHAAQACGTAVQGPRRSTRAGDVQSSVQRPHPSVQDKAQPGVSACLPRHALRLRAVAGAYAVSCSRSCPTLRISAACSARPSPHAPWLLTCSWAYASLTPCPRLTSAPRPHCSMVLRQCLLALAQPVCPPFRQPNQTQCVAGHPRRTSSAMVAGTWGRSDSRTGVRCPCAQRWQLLGGTWSTAS